MDTDLPAIIAAQRGPFTRGQALAAGYTRKEIDHRLASGAWFTLRRGVYVDRSLAPRDDDRARHLLAADAALLTLRSDAYLSHRSAAIAWELPLLGPMPGDVALTIERQHRRRAPGLELHTASTPPAHRAVVDGRPMTSVARTVSDVARSRPVAESVIVADAALHLGRCTSADIERVVGDLPVWRGIARTKRVLAFADQRSESPGESISRVAMHAAGLPAPDLQVELLLGGRRMRVDFMWPGRRLVGEFDGRVKYETREDLFAEKRREDLIRSHGYGVVRWSWRDVHPVPDAMVRRLRDALER